MHIQNLIGIDIIRSSATPPLFVRDLPLYPLPIITDEMSIYELLGIFQLGMSRTAIVIPASSCLGEAMQDSSIHGPVFWTGTKRTNAKIESNIGQKSARNWEADFIAATQFRGRHVVGIKSPKPIGIVTFEDIIDSLLQRTSHDEKDFFDRRTSFPPKKSRKTGDQRPSLLNIRHATTIEGSDILIDTMRNLNDGILRQRNISTRTIAAMDGADENRSVSSGSCVVHTMHKQVQSSSYTYNSQGGFHHGMEITDGGNGDFASSQVTLLSPDAMNISSINKVQADNVSSHWTDASDDPRPPFESATLPSRRPSLAVIIKQNSRRNATAAARLVQDSAKVIFSSKKSSDSGTRDDDLQSPASMMPPPSSAGEESQLILNSRLPEFEQSPQYRILPSQGSSIDTISLSSWGGDADLAPIFDADAVSIGAEQNNLDAKVLREI